MITFPPVCFVICIIKIQTLTSTMIGNDIICIKIPVCVFHIKPKTILVMVAYNFDLFTFLNSQWNAGIINGLHPVVSPLQIIQHFHFSMRITISAFYTHVLSTRWSITWLFQCRTHEISNENTSLQVSFFLYNGYRQDLAHILNPNILMFIFSMKYHRPLDMSQIFPFFSFFSF